MLCEEDGLALGWAVSTGLKTYGREIVDINFAFHSVYCGNDAVKKIESISEYLPENTTAEIRQADESYSIPFNYIWRYKFVKQC